jgi:glycosyltransferase involved in cell wall biosynthesis
MLPGAAMRRLLGKKGVVVSPSFALTRELVARRVESYFVPAAVDVSHFRPPSPEERAAARAALQLNPGEIVLLHVGHVRANRNLGGLAELARAGHRVLMVVSPRMPVERNVATELKDAGVTLLEGARPDLRRVYWAADVYVFPVVDIRSAVGVPLSVLEALACGVPVISTSFDGLPAALGRSWPGLVWAEEFADLGKAIKKTLTRQEPAASIGAAAARRFQPSSIVKEYIAIYHRVLGIHG